VRGGLLLLALAACAPRSTSSPTSPESRDPCLLTADSAGRLDTFRIALSDSVDLAHAPVPTNDSERLLFRQLYRNLVRIDCQGGVRPELAEVWSFDSAARSWTFTLRDATVSPDGSSLLATHVLASWRSHPPLLAALGIDSVIAANARTLVIGVRSGKSQPNLFAQPALAVALSPALSLASNGQFVSPSVGGPTVLDFLTIHGDLRDAIDSGVDLLVTRDAGLAEYASRKRDLQTFPLPWSRTYVLVQPPGADSLQGFEAGDSLRESLARDAVRTDARPAESGSSSCSSVITPERSDRLSRVVYQANDVVARGLAERIVALNAADPELRVEALADSAFAASLRAGRERAYILAVPRSTEDFCSTGLPFPTHALVHPLIDTRARAIVRKGSPALTTDWDGTLRLAGSVDSPGRP
jgi:hypothetical protein